MSGFFSLLLVDFYISRLSLVFFSVSGGRDISHPHMNSVNNRQQHNGGNRKKMAKGYIIRRSTCNKGGEDFEARRGDSGVIRRSETAQLLLGHALYTHTTRTWVSIVLFSSPWTLFLFLRLLSCSCFSSFSYTHFILFFFF
jgi:hypothetical protein